MKKNCLLLLCCGLFWFAPASARGPHVVLTFDDATTSQREIVAPLLQQYGFGGTFFVCEFRGFEDKTRYMSWEQIRELSQMGFEIGNHTRTHPAISRLSRDEIEKQIRYIEDKCAEYDIPRPETFAYPGYDTSEEGIAILKERGYRYARHGGNRAYLPEQDDRMMLPSYSVHNKGNCTRDFVRAALDSCPKGAVVILCLHGVPDLAHDFVSTTPEDFKQILDLLKHYRCRVTALRDL